MWFFFSLIRLVGALHEGLQMHDRRVLPTDSHTVEAPVELLENFTDALAEHRVDAGFPEGDVHVANDHV